MNIRKAEAGDLSRIGEIYVFNNRVNYFPIFQDEKTSFGRFQVLAVIEDYFRKEEYLKNIYVFDDGLIRGFLEINGRGLSKLYVDPFFQSRGVGSELISFGIQELHIDHLWTMEKNAGAISFYERHGFHLTDEKKQIEDTAEYVVKLER